MIYVIIFANRKPSPRSASVIIAPAANRGSWSIICCFVIFCDCWIRHKVLPAFDVFLCDKCSVLLQGDFKVVQYFDLDLVSLEGCNEKEITLYA